MPENPVTSSVPREVPSSKSKNAFDYLETRRVFDEVKLS
jgi:hypothetical protein